VVPSWSFSVYLPACRALIRNSLTGGLPPQLLAGHPLLRELAVGHWCAACPTMLAGWLFAFLAAHLRQVHGALPQPSTSASCVRCRLSRSLSRLLPSRLQVNDNQFSGPLPDEWGESQVSAVRAASCELLVPARSLGVMGSLFSQLSKPRHQGIMT